MEKNLLCGRAKGASLWVAVDNIDTDPRTWYNVNRKDGMYSTPECEACYTKYYDPMLVPVGLREACLKLADTLEEKSKAYGDSYRSGGAFLRTLFPDGVQPEAYDDLLTMVRVFDKYKRIANNPGKADPGGEDPFLDAAGYDILAYVRRGETR